MSGHPNAVTQSTNRMAYFSTVFITNDTVKIWRMNCMQNQETRSGKYRLLEAAVVVRRHSRSARVSPHRHLQRHGDARETRPQDTKESQPSLGIPSSMNVR